jgi:hypothetical protein
MVIVSDDDIPESAILFSCSDYAQTAFPNLSQTILHMGGNSLFETLQVIESYC